jgi:dimeric dUTPase (all-alpha-NTP-PPase superfamily)
MMQKLRGRSLHAGSNQLVLDTPSTSRVDMKKKIATMLELQDSMNSKVNPDWRSAGNEWYRAIWMEASEMLEHYGWKWWKKQEADAMQVKLEIVDIVHFALSICLEENENSELDTIAAAIELAFENPKATADIRTTIELLAKETLIDQGAHFAIISGVMKHVAMPFDELYEIYVGKNVLNMFRQDHGYKEGTYLKIWDGREDNEYLADILERLDCNSESFRGDIYEALTEYYPAGMAA